MTVDFGDRYQQATLIGTGSEGVVYQVFDRAMGCYVALKTFAIARDTDTSELKKEFRTLVSVNSPNVVVFHELEVRDDRAFFTMELVDGLDLATYIDPDAEPAVRVSRLLAVLPRIIDGVHAMHGAGVLHGDLKPANILVRVDGTVKLVDFGLSRDASRSAHEALGNFRGTPSLMSPELARGEPLTPLGDWYALGATLFLVLTGRPAYSHLELFERRYPPRVDTLVPEVPPWLALLIEDLLDPDPSSRQAPRPWGSAGPAVDPATEPRASDPFSEAFPFIGRDAFVARLERALPDAHGPRPGALIVKGPSGIGKSFLLREFARRAEHVHGARVFFGQCHFAEAVAYRGVDRILDELAADLARRTTDEVSALEVPHLADLFTVFPTFSRVTAWRAREARVAREVQEVQRRAFESLTAIVGHFGRVVLVIDDAQWCDQDSLRVLAALTMRGACPNLLVVLALRSEPLYEAVAKRIERQLAAHADAIIALSPWGEADIRALLRELGATDIADRTATQVLDISGGLPLFAHDLAADALAGGIPTSWEALIEKRLDTLPAIERAAIDIASVAEHPMPLSDLVALTCDDPREGVNAIRRLLATRLLAPSPDEPPRVQLYHQRVAEAAQSFIAAPRRAALHARIAETLTHRLDVDPALIAKHLEQAGVSDPSEVRELLLASAERARRKLAFDQASRLYLAALETDPTRGLPLLVQAASALALSGRSEEAARMYDEITQRTSDPAQAASARRDAADQWLRSGDSVRGESRLREVLRDRGLGFPSSMVAALVTVLWGRIKVDVRGTPFTPSAGPPDPEVLARVDACWSATLGLNHLDIMRSAAFQTRHLRLALKSGDRARAVRGLSTEFVYRVAEGAPIDGARVKRFMAQAGALAEESGDGAARGFYTLCLSAAEVFAGRWREAIATSHRAEALLVENQGRGTWEAWNCLMYRTWAATHLGDFTMLEEELLPAIEAAEARGDRSARAALSSGRSNLVWLVAGRAEEAAARAQDAIAAFPAEPFQTPHYFDLFAQTNLALSRGDGVGAWKRMCEGWSSLRKIFFLRMRYFRIEARWLRARAALAAAASGQDEARAAVQDLDRQIRALRKEGPAYASAYASFLDAARARLAGDDAQCRKQAGLANRAFASTGQAHLEQLSFALRERRDLASLPGHRIFLPWDR
jgi:hypothetical protein